ncbi:TauD/TfdA family dioxygenase [Pseudoxanthomonas putridarboris]|uniref:TauD/TfdA family dioxygenase n=1 Tax=Pseudoxanthomonas putridarboris TaxID=752605 RepID=A0ABU9J1V2_9GAMM
MEVAIREAVAKVLTDPTAPDWIAKIDLNPALVGEHVLKQLEEVTKAQIREEAETHIARGLLHLKNAFATDTEMPDSPTDFVPLPACRPVHTARLTVLAVNALLGHAPVSYGSENDGHLFVNLVAMRGEGRIAEKSTKSMRGHTDAVSFPFPGQRDTAYQRIAPSPDVVCLVGMRNPQSVPTMIINLDEALELLNATDISELEKLQFIIKCQGTFREGTARELGKEHQIDGVNVLANRGGGVYWTRFSHSGVAPSFSAPDAAENAIAKFEKACSKVAQPVIIDGGDVLIIDNRRMLHGRSEVGKEVGGRARWLLRSYGLSATHIPNDSFHDGSLFKLWP